MAIRENNDNNFQYGWNGFNAEIAQLVSSV